MVTASKLRIEKSLNVGRIGASVSSGFDSTMEFAKTMQTKMAVKKYCHSEGQLRSIAES